MKILRISYTQIVIMLLCSLASVLFIILFIYLFDNIVLIEDLWSGVSIFLKDQFLWLGIHLYVMVPKLP